MVTTPSRRSRLAAVASALLVAACAYGLQMHPVTGDDPRPKLAWQGIEGASYDLRVFRDADGRCIYERRRLPDPFHRVVIALEPGAYRWTVRPCFGSGKDLRVGPWSLADGPAARRAIVPLPLDAMHGFVIGQGAQMRE